MTEEYIYKIWGTKSKDYKAYIIEATRNGKKIARLKWVNGTITYESEVKDGELRLKMEALLSDHLEKIEKEEQYKLTAEDMEDFYGW